MREETMRLIREEEDRIRKREEMFKVISRFGPKSFLAPDTRDTPPLCKPPSACLCVCSCVCVCVCLGVFVFVGRGE
jgi:hypothetical protein